MTIEANPRRQLINDVTRTKIPLKSNCQAHSISDSQTRTNSASKFKLLRKFAEPQMLPEQPRPAQLVALVFRTTQYSHPICPQNEIFKRVNHVQYLEYLINVENIK